MAFEITEGSGVTVSADVESPRGDERVALGQRPRELRAERVFDLLPGWCCCCCHGY